MRLPVRFSVRHVPDLSLLLLFTVATTAAAPVARTPATGRVQGHVRDAKGAPIAQAQVFIVGTADRKSVV